MTTKHLPIQYHGFHADPETGACYRTLDFLGFPGYRVGDDGSVWSCRPQNNKGKWLDQWIKLQPGLRSDGYFKVSLCRGSGYRGMNRKLHRLVLLAFVGLCPPGMECCHKDDVSVNNTLSNLRWDTRKSNVADKHARGRPDQSGSKNSRAKLKESDVGLIVLRIGRGETDKSIAVDFGVTPQLIRRIRSGKCWARYTGITIP